MSTAKAKYTRCSRPPLLILFIVFFLLLPTRGRFYDTVLLQTMPVVVTLRWLIAILRQEQNSDWVIYLVLLFIVPCSVDEISNLLASSL
jgi:hypothetical protein